MAKKSECSRYSLPSIATLTSKSSTDVVIIGAGAAGMVKDESSSPKNNYLPL